MWDSRSPTVLSVFMSSNFRTRSYQVYWRNSLHYSLTRASGSEICIRTRSNAYHFLIMAWSNCCSFRSIRESILISCVNWYCFELLRLWLPYLAYPENAFFVEVKGHWMPNSQPLSARRFHFPCDLRLFIVSPFKNVFASSMGSVLLKTVFLMEGNLLLASGFFLAPLHCLAFILCLQFDDQVLIPTAENHFFNDADNVAITWLMLMPAPPSSWIHSTTGSAYSGAKFTLLYT